MVYFPCDIIQWCNGRKKSILKHSILLKKSYLNERFKIEIFSELPILILKFVVPRNKRHKKGTFLIQVVI